MKNYFKKNIKKVYKKCKKISHALTFNRRYKQATMTGEKRAIEGSDSVVAGLKKKQRKATALGRFVNSWFSGIRTLDL